MTGWLPSLRIAGVEVRVHLLLFAVPALLALTAPAFDGAVGWRLGVFAILVGCVLVHELGHAVAARARGLAAEVRVHGIGAWARIGRREAPEEVPADEWAVALAGPAASFALAGVVALAGLALRGPWSVSDLFQSPPDPWTMALAITTGMGVVNLLPMFPLDGGRVVRAVLSPALGRSRRPPAGPRGGRARARPVGDPPAGRRRAAARACRVPRGPPGGARERAEAADGAGRRRALEPIPVGALLRPAILSLRRACSREAPSTGLQPAPGRLALRLPASRRSRRARYGLCWDRLLRAGRLDPRRPGYASGP